MLKENYTCTATDFVVYQPTFINCIPRIENPFAKKFKKCFDRITKIDLSIRKDFMNFGRKKKKEIIDRQKEAATSFNPLHSVVAYPTSDIKEILMIMKSLKLNSIPIAKNPWNKKFIGYMKKESIEKELGGK